MLAQKATLKFDKLTIVKQTFVHGDLVVPGESYKVPGEVGEEDALLLVGIGKAVTGDSEGPNAAVIKKAVAEFKSAQRSQAERDARLKGPSLADLTAAIVEQSRISAEMLSALGGKAAK